MNQAVEAEIGPGPTVCIVTWAPRQRIRAAGDGGGSEGGASRWRQPGMAPEQSRWAVYFVWGDRPGAESFSASPTACLRNMLTVPASESG
jgi:hypothetical protein